MEFNNNLDFADVMFRYTILMAIGIIAGATQQYWLVIPAMMVFLTAVLGWCPVKAMATQKRTAKTRIRINRHINYNKQIRA